MRQKSSSDEDSGYPGVSFHSRIEGSKTFMTTLPLRPSVLRMNSAESNSEDFRSVIDDLTVENKKLKRKLRKLEKVHCSQLEGDKLFEVRIHRLPASKKRELEGTLRLFASSIDQSSEPSPNLAVGSHQPMNLPHPPLRPKLSSVSTIFSRPADSAYASMSASGQTSTSQLQYHEMPGRTEPRQSLDQNIKSYLHDIPQGLLPREAPFMTEKAKTKLVVQRLEQLFTGKSPSSAHTSHSLQQQQISQSAAKDERNANKARGKELGSEGSREARIQPANSGSTLDMTKEPRVQALLQISDDGDDCNTSTLNTSGGITPDQRPTRPLDLDPHRAQNPTENIEYIRHLGLASPSLNPGSNTSACEGWVYLNLLIGMAQLHTINVTVDFVRKAVQNVSDKLELSEDGQKIKWKGGSQGTYMSNDSESSPDPTTKPLSEGVHHLIGFHNASRPSDQLKYPSLDLYGADLSSYSHEPSSLSFGAECTRRPIFLGQFHGNSRLDYEPLFFHGTRSEEEEDYYLHDGDSLMSSALAEDKTGEHADFNGTTYDNTPVNSGKRAEDGPIIYYNRVKFCTDLSGDTDIASRDTTRYSTTAQYAIGYRPQTIGSHKKTTDYEPCLQRSESVHSCDDSILDWPAHNFNDEKIESDDDISIVRKSALPFVASGVGGIQPADHFTIFVDVRHWDENYARNFEPSNLDVPQQSNVSTSITSCIVDASGLPYSSCHPLRSKSKVINTIKVYLDPSKLPSPSHVVLPSSVTDSVFDEADSLDLDDVPSAAYSHLIDAGQSNNPVSISSPVRDVLLESFNTISDVSSEDSSMDLLAHARELDPDTIAAQEKEFEDHAFQMATFIQESETPFALAEESAASIEGGSCASTSETDADTISSRSLKRERTMDGMYRSSKKARHIMTDGI